MKDEDRDKKDLIAELKELRRQVAQSKVLSTKSSDFLSTEEALRRRDGILHAVSFAAEQFLRASPGEGNIESILGKLGEAVDVSRVYVFENSMDKDGVLRTSQRYEWTARDVLQQTYNPDVVDFPWHAGGMGRWVEPMRRGEVIEGHVKDFPPSEQKILAPQGIVSIVAVPIFVENEWWGFIGFDECYRERRWSVAEQEALKAAANILGVAVEHMRAGKWLQEAHDELEKKVRERTFDLTLANTRLEHEIEERRRAEQVLRETRREKELILDGLQEHVIHQDKDMRILWANKAACASAGLERNELMRRHCYEVWFQRDEPCSDCAVKRALETGRPQRKEKVTSDGKAYLIRGYPVRSILGEVVSAIEITLEITDRKRIEQQLLRAKKAAEDANLAKSQFLANMSHEIRTPISAIMGMTDMALSDPTGGRQKECLQFINESANSLLNIVNDLLNLSKIEAGRLSLSCEPFDLCALVKSCVDVFGLQAKEKGIALEYSIADGVPGFLKGDPGRLRQVLVNLVGNAVKFTERGEVRIEVELEGAERGAPGGGAKERLTFSVNDTGIGIPEHHKGKLFRRFSQIDSSPSKRHPGTGLGLAICKRLVELMGGRIWFSSTEGIGSAFCFSVPLETAHPGAEVNQDGAPKRNGRTRGEAPQKQPPLKILLAEDNFIIQMATRCLLEEAGHKVVSVSDGKEALSALPKDRFDLVLMDIQMPEMDGLEATRRIRASGCDSVDPEIPIIALTAYAMESDKERLMKAGMNGFISKPLENEELFRMIGRIAAKRGLNNTKI